MHDDCEAAGKGDASLLQAATLGDLHGPCFQGEGLTAPGEDRVGSFVQLDELEKTIKDPMKPPAHIKWKLSKDMDFYFQIVCSTFEIKKMPYNIWCEYSMIQTSVMRSLDCRETRHGTIYPKAR